MRWKPDCNRPLRTSSQGRLAGVDTLNVTRKRQPSGFSLRSFLYTDSAESRSTGLTAFPTVQTAYLGKQEFEVVVQLGHGPDG